MFNIPGMSGALLTGINQRDFALVQAVVFVFTLIFLVANLIADLTNAWLDPRRRRGSMTDLRTGRNAIRPPCHLGRLTAMLGGPDGMFGRRPRAVRCRSARCWRR